MALFKSGNKKTVKKPAKKKPVVKKAVKKETTTKKRPGPKTKYNPLYHPQVVYWMANAGLTDEQIAKEFKIVRKTLHNWRRQYPDFDDALARGKEAPDERVEKSLYQRAIGYACPDVHVMQHQGKPIIVNTIKYYPPDTTAQIFWLKNRRPDQWRDRHEIDFTGKLDELIKSFRGIK